MKGIEIVKCQECGTHYNRIAPELHGQCPNCFPTSDPEEKQTVKCRVPGCKEEVCCWTHKDKETYCAKHAVAVFKIFEAEP